MGEEIWHHGVIGMHWGVRRTPAQLGHKIRSRKAKPDNSHEDYKKTHDNKDVKSMSDAELRARINRMNMEKQYAQVKLDMDKQYAQMNPSRVQRGRDILNSTLKAVSTVATATTTAVTLKNNWDTISKWFGNGNSE